MGSAAPPVWAAAEESPEAELLWGEPVSPDQLTAAEQGYERCGPAERLLWERLSVFEGAFGREAVREVCASDTLPAGDIQAVLDRLAPSRSSPSTTSSTARTARPATGCRTRCGPSAPAASPNAATAGPSSCTTGDGA